MPTAPRPGCASARTARRSESCWVRQGLKVAMLEKRTAAGLAMQETRTAKLAAKLSKRAAKATERVRIDALPLAEHYSDLKLMGLEDLQDQLKKHKLLGKAGIALDLCPTSRRTC
eukprot:6195897-Pleurochrysis_carterae.AAC.2